jgi:hypothetical protein
LLWLFWRWGVSGTICPDWPWTVILLISAFQVARITGVSHWCPPQSIFIIVIIKVSYLRVVNLLMVFGFSDNSLTSQPFQFVDGIFYPAPFLTKHSGNAITYCTLWNTSLFIIFVICHYSKNWQEVLFIGIMGIYCHSFGHPKFIECLLSVKYWIYRENNEWH